MKKLAFTIFVILAGSLNGIAQNADFTHISSLNTTIARRVYMGTLSNARKSALIQFHIDQKQSQWAAGLSEAQIDALNALRDEVTEILVANAENNDPVGSNFAAFNAALATVEGLFSTGQLTELKIVGNYDSNNYDFAMGWEVDEDTGETFAQCPKGRTCFSYCHCNQNSLCSGYGCRAPNCIVQAEGCGCWWIFECNGMQI